MRPAAASGPLWTMLGGAGSGLGLTLAEAAAGHLCGEPLSVRFYAFAGTAYVAAFALAGLGIGLAGCERLRAATFVTLAASTGLAASALTMLQGLLPSRPWAVQFGLGAAAVACLLPVLAAFRRSPMGRFARRGEALWALALPVAASVAGRTLLLWKSDWPPFPRLLASVALPLAFGALALGVLRVSAGIRRRLSLIGLTGAAVLSIVGTRQLVPPSGQRRSDHNAPPAGPSMPWPARRPNIVLIVLDTLRARSLSCYGYGRRTSPCLDAFAAQSVRYTRCTASSSWSLPSHAEILTGSLFPATFPGGADHPELSDGVTTLSEAMAQVGYATAGIAANFVVLGGRYNLEQGFQYFDARPAAGYRRLSLPTLRHRLEDRASLQVLAQAIVKGPSPFLYAEEVTARALSWITEQRPRGRPYFLFLNYLDAHATMRHRWGTLSFSEQTALMEGRRSPSYEERQHLTAAYDEAVSYLDQHVGRLLRFLLETAEAEDTWIIVTSDHGESIGEHGGVGHRADDLHQEVLHVPLLVKYPAPRAEERGKVDDRPVQLVDVLPTILDRLDLPRPAGLEGRPISERRDAMFALGGEAAAVIGGDLKYVERASGLPELFDLRDDPAEVRNLVEDRPREAAALRERLRTWRFSRRTVAVTRTMPSPEPRLLKSLGYAQ